jgi:membrane-associated phospholipid phosphatase
LKTRPAEVAAGTLPAPSERREPGYRLANAVSYVVNPLVLPPITFGLVQAHVGAGAAEIALTAVVSVVFFVLLPLAYVVWMVRRGEAESLEVRAQGKRTRPFLAGVASYAVGLTILWYIARSTPDLVIAIAALMPANTLVMALINLRWKISIHVTAIASLCSALAFSALCVAPGAWPLPPAERGGLLDFGTVAMVLPLVPLMMWARVRVEAHTPRQVLGGALYGLLVPFAELWAIGSALAA